MRLAILVTLFLQLAVVQSANASDDDGKFAVKGIGVLTCNEFLVAVNLHRYGAIPFAA